MAGPLLANDADCDIALALSSQNQRVEGVPVIRIRFRGVVGSIEVRSRPRPVDA